MKQDWTNQLRDKMAGYEEPAPEGLWDEIEKSLDSIPKNKKSHKTALITVLKYSSATMAAVALCLIGFFFINKRNYDHSYRTSSNMISEPANKNIAISKNSNISVYNNILASAKYVNIKKNTSNPNTYSAEKDFSRNILNNEVYTELPTKKEEKTDTIKSISGKDNTTNKKEYNYPKHYYNNTALAGNLHHVENKWDFNLYVSNIPSQEINNNSYSSLLMAARNNNSSMDICYGLMNDPIPGNKYNYETSDPLLNVQSNSLSKENKTKIKHKQPVRFGITAKYSLDSRWAIETGVTYTYLTSDIYSGADANNYQSKQKLHYIGIPINAIYTIWNNKIISVYISGGGMGEYCIDGKLTTDYTIDNIVESSADENIKDNHIQWSINSSIGFQYNFLPHCGIYIEPGASHHFKDGSDIQTIYKEHPTDFSLKFGIRFSIK
jgi:hypothetical protein